MNHNFRLPQPEEFNNYYNTYIGKVPEGNILSLLQQQQATTSSFLSELSAQKWDYAYGPDKWSIKEVMVHIIDTERIFAYRGLRIARGDMKSLPGFDQNDYIPNSFVNQRSNESVMKEYHAVRQASLALFEGLAPESHHFIGTASEFPLSPAACVYIIAGHEIHHMNIIKERYF